MIDEIRNTKGLFTLIACFPYLVSLYSKKIFFSVVHCTVRKTTDSLEVNLSFLFCRKELWRRRRRRHSYKERTLYYNFGVSLSLKNYYCLEKARLASNQLGASSNGWHLICGEERRSGREIGASPLAKVQAAAARCILAARQVPPTTILGHRRRRRECMTTA